MTAFVFRVMVQLNNNLIRIEIEIKI
jgi:hypothetical protein